MAASPSDDLAKALGEMADEEAGAPQTPTPPPAATPRPARSARPDAPVPSPVRPATPTHTPDDEEIEGVLEDDEAEDEASPKLHVQAPPRRVQQQTQQILDARPVNRQPPPASPPASPPAVAPASDDPMAQAAAAAAAPRRTPVRPGAKKKKSSDLSATAAPVLLTVGLLLMVPAVWAVMILRGYENAWGADRPNAGMMAKLMLSAWPMGLILIGSGIYCFIKAFKAPKK